MNGLVGGLFGTTHKVLNSTGRAAALVLFGERALREGTSYALVGGAVLGSVGGCVVGFIASVSMDAATVNKIFGVAIGMSFGSVGGLLFGIFVRHVDALIESTLNDTNSK